MTPPSIQRHDVLFLLFLDLIAEGQALEPYDCDRRLAWFAACRDLLQALPDLAQRMAWAMSLSNAFNCPGVQRGIVLTQLFHS